MKYIATILLLLIASCGWKTEYGIPVEGTAVVTNTYHRNAYSTYIPPAGKHGVGHWTHHPEVWRITIYVNEIRKEFVISGQYAYEMFRKGDALKVTYREVWDVKYKKNSNIEEKRKFDKHELLTYTR